MITIAKEHKKPNYTIATLKKNGNNYEVIIDCESAIKFKKGEGTINDALLADKIFKNARTGDVHGGLKDVFGTDDVLVIAEEIIKKGEFPLTEEYRKKVLDELTNQVIGQVTSKASDPATHYPIPRERIELGITKSGYKIRLDKNPSEQVKELMELLPTIMQVTFKELILTITSPAQFAGQAYGIAKKNGEVISENYLPDGALIVKIKLSPQRKKELSDKLGTLSHGLIKIQEE